MNELDHLATLDDNRMNWTLKLRVTRMWPSTNNAGVVPRHNLYYVGLQGNNIYFSHLNTYLCIKFLYFSIHPITYSGTNVLGNNHKQAYVTPLIWNVLGGIVNRGGTYIIRHLNISNAIRL